MSYKIAVTGPESCGKSTMCSILSKHYNTQHTVEFARLYLENKPSDCSAELIQYFASQQIAQENALLPSSQEFLFCDTDLINFKIWLEYDGHDVPEWLMTKINTKAYPLTLLLYPDLPWEPDPLRMYPKKRMYFFEKFREELALHGMNYSIITGDGAERNANAITAIQNHLKK